MIQITTTMRMMKKMVWILIKMTRMNQQMNILTMMTWVGKFVGLPQNVLKVFFSKYCQTNPIFSSCHFLPRLFNFVNLFFTAVITTRHELLEDFYAKVSPALIQRFKEREENVKADIFHAYVALLKQTKTAILPQLALQGILILLIIVLI